MIIMVVATLCATLIELSPNSYVETEQLTELKAQAKQDAETVITALSEDMGVDPSKVVFSDCEYVITNNQQSVDYHCVTNLAELVRNAYPITQ